MIDVLSAYRPVFPESPGNLGTALVDYNGELIEMYVVSRWLEGKRYRYNLAQFSGGRCVRELRGWNGDGVTMIGGGH